MKYINHLMIVLLSVPSSVFAKNIETQYGLCETIKSTNACVLKCQGSASNSGVALLVVNDDDC